LHATLAHWSEDQRSLTVYDATQYVIGIQEMLATKFSLAKDQVRVIGSFVGGGFGGKGNAWAHVSLAVAAAKVVKRPVKLMLSREGVHLTVGGRTPTEQRVALAANADGKLTALIHTGFTQTTEHNNFPEQFTFPARHLYKSATIWLRQEIVHLDIVPNTFWRPENRPAPLRSNRRSMNSRTRSVWTPLNCARGMSLSRTRCKASRSRCGT
jgi:xanthine dehydrogenase YagR molybdenum-binding subunit